jgi:hypothetical protein
VASDQPSLAQERKRSIGWVMESAASWEQRRHGISGVMGEAPSATRRGEERPYEEAGHGEEEDGEHIG